MSINTAFLKEVCEIAGAPGFEKRIRDLVVKEVTPLVDEVKIDNIGNVIAVKKGKNNPDGKKVMVAAHMDEIGFIVNHIDDNGFLRFHTLGGFDPKTLTAQRVIVHGKKDLVGVMGSKPIHVMSPEERNKMPKTTDYFIDLGLPKEEVDKYVKVGDPITRDRELVEMGDCVNCKSIDNRVAVFILIEALKTLENPPYDVYATFTVQEEVGLRGANVAAHGINPDFGIALDTTVAYDLPGASPHEKITELGKGTAVKIMDAMTICDYRMVEFMKKTADNKQIQWQPEILTAGGTDTAGVQRMGKQGAIAGAISIPTRHLHQVIEMAHKHDIDSSIRLLNACLEGIDQYDWKH
ncbi:M42 family metallopeptidase [Echinicola jeungdonensis]|uniref:M42 family metallopeptidase n=1 Tax=Echinicola jeungdonensis TaxID=709343 RepID=A0ABV5J7W4_9BACT|nr:M42 family metallopeptidase [Echinicola jeungdonensis]MDN3670018.1 M42 family metallopeptidase [Echinicola jeungdonensis]